MKKILILTIALLLPAVSTLAKQGGGHPQGKGKPSMQLEDHGGDGSSKTLWDNRDNEQRKNEQWDNRDNENRKNSFDSNRDKDREIDNLTDDFDQDDAKGKKGQNEKAKGKPKQNEVRGKGRNKN